MKDRYTRRNGNRTRRAIPEGDREGDFEDAAALARLPHNGGQEITAAAANLMNPGAWRTFAKQIGAAEPNVATIQQARAELGRLERAAPYARGPAGALGTADTPPPGNGAAVRGPVDVRPMARPGKPLSGAQVTARALDQAAKRGEDLLAEYRRRFGNVLNADNAAELFPDYAASVESRTKYRDAVHPAAQWVRDELFNRALKDPKVKEVVFTAGGPGAGKSTGGAAGDVVMDTIFSGPNAPARMVKDAPSAGKRVEIVYTYRPIEDALAGVLERSKTQGRTAPIDYLIENHERAARNVEMLYEQYRDNPSVHFRFVDNSGENPSLGTIALTKKQSYGGTRTQLHAILEAKRSEITDSVYRATKGPGGREAGR